MSKKLPTQPKFKTLQSVFNVAWTAFVIEGRPQSTKDGGVPRCRYAGYGCAIGVGLPLPLCRRMDKSAEGSISSLLDARSPVNKEVSLFYSPSINREALNALQLTHDDFKLEEATETWAKYIRHALQDYATTHRLKIPKRASTLIDRSHPCPKERSNDNDTPTHR